MKNKGLDAWFVSVKVKDATYYRLYVGHYASMEEATAEMTKLKADKKIPADSFIRKS